MVGTYKSYFRNVKRKGKVFFDHSTTLSENQALVGTAWCKQTQDILTGDLKTKKLEIVQFNQLNSTNGPKDSKTWRNILRQTLFQRYVEWVSTLQK